ncbi:hypothetical protein [Clostridium sp. HMP27]|uniref:hypothetical protein n=1 Tax=Clostridium sp. HMP27 TaxID=1487921 RepID=UPI00052DD169|nr:hypothetical protein [Clostridium sp. HMP27]KGK86118.1 hypothetical protein DP68_14970 [Clostridium sp. HMP27]
MPYFLIIISLTLIVLNIISFKKDKNSFKHILINKEENIQNYEVEIGKLRREMGETILDIQTEMRELKEKINALEYAIRKEESVKKQYNIIQEESLINIEEVNKNIEIHNEGIKAKNYGAVIDNKDDNRNSVKLEEIKKLIDKGMNEEEIAEVLHIGRGEMLLIKELYLK